jgi:hypothetical protein
MVHAVRAVMDLVGERRGRDGGDQGGGAQGGE